MMNNAARLFVAISIPPSAQQALTQLQKQIQSSKLCDATYPSADKMHVTLVFLGWCNPNLIAPIIDALKTVQYPSFTVQFDAIDTFERKGKPGVLFAKSTTSELANLTKRISQQLAPFYEPENRSFVGHLTLARIKKIHDSKQFHELITNLSFSPLAWNVSSFALLESKKIGEQRVYHTHDEFSLI